MTDAVRRSVSDPARSGVDRRPATLAAGLYRERRARDAAFGPLARLFRDPAWDVLLHLFVVGEEGGVVCAGGAASASATPTTTGLRCVEAMVEAGLLHRRTDPDDARRSILTLTTAARRAMLDYLDVVRTERI